MYEQISIKTDVLVIGAGLAGIMAALSAAENNAGVCLMSRDRICSGSSFYPGTWGLGLVGPEDKSDEQDLENVILNIGENMTDAELVHTLVSGVTDGIRYLEKLGIPLRRAVNKNEKAFIPCFDYKNRSWHGLEKADSIPVFKEHLSEKNVRMLEHTTVISLLKDKSKDAVTGALALDKDGRLFHIMCDAVILATGGLGGLFRYRLNTDDVRATGQYLALKAGASLANLEFMQMMPGYISPSPKTIYNEKLFRHSDFSVDGQKLFEDWDKEERQACMDVRSTHGPFTSRLNSGKIDRELFQAFLEHPEGIKVVYQDDIKKNQPEFVKTYFDWLEKEKHLTADDPVWIGIFAHATNGGIRIDTKARTNVRGLYACGEATGMMHGADRLGGLSTANGLVFGRIAGEDAAKFSGSLRSGSEEAGENAECTDTTVDVVEHASEYLGQIREWNFRSAMILRSERQSEETLKKLKELKDKAEQEKRTVTLFETPLTEEMAKDIRKTVDLEAAIELSTALHQAILLRKESRGSHYRTDFPQKAAHLEKTVVSRMYGGKIETDMVETTGKRGRFL